MPMPPRKPRPSHQLLSNNSLTTKDNGNGRYFGNSCGHVGSFRASSPTTSNLTGFPGPNTIQHQQQQQQHQPPLITDTLTACLDVNGTYVCTPYSPRCYIIQKVTPNSVTVTPTPQIPLTPSNHVGASGLGLQIPGSSSGLIGTINHVQPISKFNNGLIGQCSSSLPPTSYNNHHVPPPAVSTPQNSYRHSSLGLNHTSGNKQRIITSSSKNPLGFVDQKSTTSSGLSSGHAGSRAYMNGEIGSPLPPVGDVISLPSMGFVPHCTTSSGTHITDNRSLSGASRDGPGIMSRDKMALNNDTDSDESGIRNALDDHGQRSAVKDEQGSNNLHPEELRQLMITQLEYYFSPENLSNDKFLVSQMDSDQYVYISTVSNFNMIKKLSSDLDLITDVLKESKQVQVHSDGKRVRPISNRTVVILRGIPESTPVEEIKGLFDKENAPKCNNCEFAFNDSWYLSFDSDDEAVRAHRYLREDVREFKGHSVMARIKSRPTTLLSQGVGVPQMKNGFHPSPQHTHAPYVNISAAYVQASQPGSANTVVATAPMFPGGQQVSSAVFTIPQSPYANFATQLPWGGYYDLNPSMSPMYSINGLPPPSQQQPSPGYQKTAPMALRHRNPNLPRGPRRPGPGDGHIHNANGGSSHQYGGNSGGGQHRKSNSTGAPTPLLGMAPANMPLGVHSPLITHNHHGLVPTSMSNSNANSTNISRNGGQGYGMGPPQQSSVPHVNNHSLDGYHPSNSRSYRGDPRPRSSLSNRKAPQRHREDDGGYESTQGAASVTTSNRGNPSSRTGTGTAAPSPVSPQLSTTQVVSSNSQQHQGRTNFDLEASAFPPLPGSADSALRNGETPYEGRLSDVVKGVKSLKIASGEKEDVGIGTSATRMPCDGTSASVPELPLNTSASYVVSVASPTKDVENEIAQPSQSFVAALPVSGNKKEFREVGVGSADDSHDIRTPSSREYHVFGGRGKETADKSTRTDNALLHGDQSGNGSRGIESRHGGGNGSRNDGNEVHQAGNYRKSVPQSTKSPIVGKRGLPGFQGPPMSSSSVAVGPEVPYSIQSLTTSPVASPVKSSPFSVPLGSVNSSSSSATGGGAGRVGSGAVTYVAKTQMDNNRGGASGGGGTSQGLRSNLNTSDKDAFPTPGFVKSNVPMVKPFSGATEHSSKEGNRIEDDDKHKTDGIVGSGKKAEDNICSIEDRDGSVRLSYAQVAQSGKEKAPASSTTQITQASNTISASSSGHNNIGGSTSVPGVQGTHGGDEKKRSFNEAKDMRTQFKPHPHQRANSGNDGPERDRDRDRDRDRGDRGRRRGFRPRMFQNL